MPEKIMLDLTPAEAELFESEYGNNPELLLADAGIDLKSQRKNRWAFIGSAITISLLIGVIVLMNNRASRAEVIATALKQQIADNHLIPKGEGRLEEAKDLFDPHHIDQAGRNYIAIACAEGDLIACIYWSDRGTDWNQPRFAGRFVSEILENGRVIKKFARSEDEVLRHRSPIMIAAATGNYHIVQYMLHDDRKHLIDWNYSCFGQNLLSTLQHQKRRQGEDAPKILDECIMTLAGFK